VPDPTVTTSNIATAEWLTPLRKIRLHSGSFRWKHPNVDPASVSHQAGHGVLRQRSRLAPLVGLTPEPSVRLSPDDREQVRTVEAGSLFFFSLLRIVRHKTRQGWKTHRRWITRC
jgi:hypothetical protein